MTPEIPVPVLLLLSACIGLAAVACAALVVRWTRWGPAGGIALLAATPLVPHVQVALGFSLDDILPLLGLGALLLSVRLRNLRRLSVHPVLTIGLILMIGAALLSAVVNRWDAASLFTMAARSAGRFAFLAAIAVTVAVAVPAPTRRKAVAIGIALTGAAEAAFGLFAFAVPSIGLGLEPTKSYSVLHFEVPGRLAGTLGISPNFLGAIFILSVLLSAGLALDAKSRKVAVTWWVLTAMQTLALVLTFTRASLGITLVALVALVLSRGRIRYLVPVALAVVVGFTMTPALQRFTADMPDRLALWSSAALMMVDHPIAGVGPGQSVVVERANPDRYMTTAFGSATNNAHNTILLAGAETGVAGAIGSLMVNLSLALGAVLVVLRARRLGRSAVESAAGIAVLGYLIQGQVNNLFTVAASGTLFALLAGAFVLPSIRRRQRAPVSASERPADPLPS